MPARTNEFQRLVMMINRSLSPKGATVTESAMLYDSEAQTDREIDILVQAKVSGYDVSIGIECTTVAKPVEVRILEAFKEKHRKVGINKTIVVSKNGFTKPSKEYAKKNHIQLLTFNSAGKEKWSKALEPFKNMSIYGRTYRVKSISVVGDEEDMKGGFIVSHELQVLGSDGYIPLSEFCGILWAQSEAAKTYGHGLRENELSATGTPWLEVGFNLQKSVVFKDVNGIEVRPNHLSFVMDYTSTYQSLNAKEVEYDGNTYVVGAFENKKEKQFAHFALNQVGEQIRGEFAASTNMIPSIKKPGA